MPIVVIAYSPEHTARAQQTPAEEGNNDRELLLEEIYLIRKL